MAYCIRRILVGFNPTVFQISWFKRWRFGSPTISFVRCIYNIFSAQTYYLYYKFDFRLAISSNNQCYSVFLHYVGFGQHAFCQIMNLNKYRHKKERERKQANHLICGLPAFQLMLKQQCPLNHHLANQSVILFFQCPGN